MTRIEIAYYRQEWVNDHAVDLPGGSKVFTVNPLTEEMYHALDRVASAETDCEGIELLAEAYLQDVYVFTWDGPFYIRLVIDGIESDLNLLEGQHAVLDEWLEKTTVVSSFDPKKIIASVGWDRDDELALAHDFIASLGLDRQWCAYLARVAAEEAAQGIPDYDEADRVEHHTAKPGPVRLFIGRAEDAPKGALPLHGGDDMGEEALRLLGVDPEEVILGEMGRASGAPEGGPVAEGEGSES